jgi:hypothetical protein
MFNTVENRRRILLFVVAMILFHAFASGWLIPLDSVKDKDMHDSLYTLYAEYDLLWHDLKGGP